jgi:hypothetical protein
MSPPYGEWPLGDSKESYLSAYIVYHIYTIYVNRAIRLYFSPFSAYY